jgi:hypothetical protein
MPICKGCGKESNAMEMIFGGFRCPSCVEKIVNDAVECYEEEGLMDTSKMFGIWRCDECGEEINVSYDELVEIGNPICLEGQEMELIGGFIEK